MGSYFPALCHTGSIPVLHSLDLRYPMELPVMMEMFFIGAVHCSSRKLHVASIAEKLMERHPLQSPTSRLRYHSHDISIELNHTFPTGEIAPPRQQKLVLGSKGEKLVLCEKHMYTVSTQTDIKFVSYIKISWKWPLGKKGWG